MATENGNYVTRAELRAEVNPIKSDVKEIKADVKSLLLAHAADDAVKAVSKDKGARRMGLAGLAAGTVAALYWVPDAIAKVFH